MSTDELIARMRKLSVGAARLYAFLRVLPMPLDTTQANLAKVVGSYQPHVSKQLAELLQAGLIGLQSRQGKGFTVTLIDRVGIREAYIREAYTDEQKNAQVVESKENSSSIRLPYTEDRAGIREAYTNSAQAVDFKGTVRRKHDARAAPAPTLPSAEHSLTNTGDCKRARDRG